MFYRLQCSRKLHSLSLPQAWTRFIRSKIDRSRLTSMAKICTKSCLVLVRRGGEIVLQTKPSVNDVTKLNRRETVECIVELQTIDAKLQMKVCGQ